MIPHDDTTTRPRGAAVRAREDAVIAQLHSLAPRLDGEPDPAFRAATRARLVAMSAVRSPAPRPVSAARTLLSLRDSGTPPRWRARLTAGLAGAALTVTALATLVAVSAGTRPGDPLYGLKRGTEQTQLALTSDSTRGQTLLEFASNRLEELRTLVDDGTTALPAAGAGQDGTTVLAAGASPELVLQTLRTMSAETRQGAASLDGRAVDTGSTAPLERLSGWLSGQSSGLEALRPDMPAATGQALTDSLGLLADISTRVAGLRTALDCSSGPATSGTDELGPLPGPCVVPPSPSTAGPGAPKNTPPQGSGARVPAAPTGSAPVSAAPGTGTAPARGAGSAGSPAPLLTGTVPAPPTGGGSLPSLPVPSVPLPTGKLPLPSVTLPGPSLGTPGPPSSSPLLGLCIGPVTLGDC